MGKTNNRSIVDYGGNLCLRQQGNSVNKSLIWHLIVKQVQSIYATAI